MTIVLIRRIRPGRLLAAAIAAALACLPQPAFAQNYPLVSPPPSSEDFSAACTKRRSVETCICAAHILAGTGEGQFAMEMEIRRRSSGDAAETNTALLDRYHLTPQQARAMQKASSQAAKVAFAACQ